MGQLAATQLLVIKYLQRGLAAASCPKPLNEHVQLKRYKKAVSIVSP